MSTAELGYGGVFLSGAQGAVIVDVEAVYVTGMSSREDWGRVGVLLLSRIPMLSLVSVVCCEFSSSSVSSLPGIPT